MKQFCWRCNGAGCDVCEGFFKTSLKSMLILFTVILVGCGSGGGSGAQEDFSAYGYIEITSPEYDACQMVQLNGATAYIKRVNNNAEVYSTLNLCLANGGGHCLVGYAGDACMYSQSPDYVVRVNTTWRRNNPTSIGWLTLEVW